eukprot:COSAG04_NODE_1363_length_7079_cov_19.484815_2_plen_188_part_00
MDKRTKRGPDSDLSSLERKQVGAGQLLSAKKQMLVWVGSLRLTGIAAAIGGGRVVRRGCVLDHAAGLGPARVAGGGERLVHARLRPQQTRLEFRRVLAWLCLSRNFLTSLRGQELCGPNRPFSTHLLPIFAHFSPIFSVWTPGIHRTRPELQGETGRNRETSGKWGQLKAGLGQGGAPRICSAWPRR